MKAYVTGVIFNVLLSVMVVLNAGSAQTERKIASTAVENEAFGPGYGHQVNIGVKSESQRIDKPFRRNLYSKTY